MGCGERLEDKSCFVYNFINVRTLRCDDYGLQATVGRVFFVTWTAGPSTQQMVLKYKVKIADYRLQTTKKEPRQTPHYKVRLVFIFCSQKLPFERLEILWFYS